MLRKWSSTSRRLRVIDSRQRHSKQSKHFGVARRAWPWRIVATPIIVPARSVIRPKRPSSENIVASGLSGGSMQFYNGTCRMLYPSRSTGPFVAISLFLLPFISLSLAFPHHSFMSFRIGNNARFNVNIESIDGERSYDERAFIRFIRFAKIIQNRFFISFSARELNVGSEWLYTYRGYNRYSFGYVISFKISYDVIEVIIVKLLITKLHLYKNLKFSFEYFQPVIWQSFCTISIAMLKILFVKYIQ